MISKAIFFGSLFSLASIAANAADATHVLDIDDRVGKFQTFYADATSPSRSRPYCCGSSLGRRKTGSPPCRPGPTATAMARQLLDAAWDRYPALVPTLAVRWSEDGARRGPYLVRQDQRIFSRYEG